MRIRTAPALQRVEIESPLSRSLAGDEPLRGGLSTRGGRPPAPPTDLMWGDEDARLKSAMLTSLSVRGCLGLHLARILPRLQGPQRANTAAKYGALVRWVTNLPANRGYVGLADYRTFQAHHEAWWNWTMDVLSPGWRSR